MPTTIIINIINSNDTKPTIIIITIIKTMIQKRKREKDNKKSGVQCIASTPSRISILYNKARLQISNNFCLKTLRNGNSNNIFVVREKNGDLLLILNLIQFAIPFDPRSDMINSISQYRSDVLISASSEHCRAVMDKCDLSDN